MLHCKSTRVTIFTASLPGSVPVLVLNAIIAMSPGESDVCENDGLILNKLITIKQTHLIFTDILFFTTRLFLSNKTILNKSSECYRNATIAVNNREIT